MRVLNYHRSYKAQCGVHEDEMAPIVAEAELEAATLARVRADKAEAALAQECPDCGLSVAQVGRIHIDAQMGHEDYLAAYVRADKAEAALAEMTARMFDDDGLLAQAARDRDAARADAKALAETITFDASEDVQGLTGTRLLTLVAMLLDKRDDETGNQNRTVQADLRRWAIRIDAALAAHKEATE